MLTAKNQVSDILAGFEAGANDFLAKPFEALEFQARVKTLAALKQSVQSAIKAEAAFLQAQIKPHFLYNTLNTIAALCSLDPEKAETLIIDLANFLRSSIDFINLEMFVPLEKEMQLVRSYVSLEQARFGPRIQVEYQIEEGLAVQIPPLMIQPIVENSIQHGLLKKVAGGSVIISVKNISNGVEISVSDNGKGMNQQRVAGLLQPKAKELASRPGIGLRNIHLRLNQLYGTSLEILSWEGKGTMVKFQIPAGGESRCLR
jgi:sensor histidine kinase YesM